MASISSISSFSFYKHDKNNNTQHYSVPTRKHQKVSVGQLYHSPFDATARHSVRSSVSSVYATPSSLCEAVQGGHVFGLGEGGGNVFGLGDPGNHLFGLGNTDSVYNMFTKDKRTRPSERIAKTATKLRVVREKKICARKKKEEAISAEVRAMVSQWKSREGGAHLCSNIRR